MSQIAAWSAQFPQGYVLAALLMRALQAQPYHEARHYGFHETAGAGSAYPIEHTGGHK